MLDWDKYIAVADRFQHKAKWQDREDLRQDIILRLATASAVNPVGDFILCPPIVGYYIAGYPYHSSIGKGLVSVIPSYLSKVITVNQGYIAEGEHKVRTATVKPLSLKSTRHRLSGI